MQELSCLMFWSVSKRYAWGEMELGRMFFSVNSWSNCAYWLLIFSREDRGSSVRFQAVPLRGLLLIVNYKLILQLSMLGSPNQQTVTLTKDAHNQLIARIEYLEAENRALQESKQYLQRENGQMMGRMEEVVCLERTVKHLSKKVLEYSKYKLQLERARMPQSSNRKQVQKLEAALQQLKAQFQEQKRKYEASCHELAVLMESKAKWQRVSGEVVSGHKRRIATLEGELKTLQGRYKRIKEENGQLNAQNEDIQTKYEKILEQFNELYDKSHR